MTELIDRSKLADVAKRIFGIELDEQLPLDSAYFRELVKKLDSAKDCAAADKLCGDVLKIFSVYMLAHLDVNVRAGGVQELKDALL